MPVVARHHSVDLLQSFVSFDHVPLWHVVLIDLRKTYEMPKLNDTFAKNAPTKNHWDSEIKGFGLFVGKRAKTWVFQRDLAGKTKRVRIGPYPTIPAAEARRTAQDLALQFARGAGKKAMQRVPTLRAATDAYLGRAKLRSEHNKRSVRAQVEKHLSDWLDLPLNEIDRAMCAQRHTKLARSGPALANHTMQSFRSIWNHARRTVDLDEAPTVAIEWANEKPKQEIIEDFEVWAKEVAALSNPIHRVYYKLLLTTGLRRSECSGLRWEHVHADHLHLPLTKNGRPFDLPLVEDHHRILEAVRGLSDEWVFPSWRGQSPHLVAPERMSSSPHAHRRTFATVAQTEAGLFEETVGRLLNHTPQSVTGSRYVVVDHVRLRGPIGEVMAAFKRLVPGLAANESSLARGTATKS